MEAQGAQQATGYVVPTYTAPPGAAWYHFLHGNVPGHQIDFMYRPEVPQGPITRQHFSHLARLVKYIEPRHRSAYAFAIGNLSRDDTQYEPGHGGVAIIFGLRIRGAKDHAGRQDPPFCHAAVAVDRHLDGAHIYQAAKAFYQQLLPDEESQAEGSGWYHTYVRYADNPDALVPLLRAYVADFDALPAPGPSRLGPRWITPEGAAAPPKRVVIVYGGREPFEAIAACAARIAGVLVESDVRWTVISNGREADVPGGVSVRFVPAHEAAGEAGDGLVLRLEEVPAEAEGVAELFGVRSARGAAPAPEQRVGWRQLYDQQAAEVEIPVEMGDAVPASQGADAAAVAVAGGEVAGGAAVGVAAVGGGGGERVKSVPPPANGVVASGLVASAAVGGAVVSAAGKEDEAKPKRAGERSRAPVGLLVGVGVVLALAGLVAAVVIEGGGKDKGGEGPGEAPSAGVTAVPTGMAIEAPSAGLTAAPTGMVIVAPNGAMTKGTANSGEKSPAPAITSPTKKDAAKPPAGGGKKSSGPQKGSGSVFDWKK